MPLSNSVIRRYTPPTCTLEVVAESSPLSQWMGKTVLKQLRFELGFDDPRLPEEKRIKIQGDRDQLEALCGVVTNYVQESLQKQPSDFWASFSTISTQDSISPDAETKDLSNSQAKVVALNPVNSPSGRNINLQPGPRLTHKLFLGPLANSTSGPVVELSQLQLFDLANALEEYSTDVMALPSLEESGKRRSVVSFPQWAPVAAVIALAVGLAPLTWRFAEQQRLNQGQTARKEQPAPEQNIAFQPIPETGAPTNPTLTPPDNLPSIPLASNIDPRTGTSLTAGEQPTNPDAIAGISPTTPNLGGSSTPNGNIATSSGVTLPGTNDPMNPINTSPSGIVIPGTPGKTTPSGGSTSTMTIPTSPSSADKTKPGSPVGSSSTTIASAPKNSGIGQFSSTPSSPKTGITSQFPKLSDKPPTLPEIPNSTSTGITTTIPGRTTAPGVPPIPGGNVTTPPQTPTISGTASRPGTVSDQLRSIRQNPSGIPSTEVATGDTLVGVSQVTETKKYFQQKWRPPAGLTQGLEYRIQVGIDGSLEEIIPLGKASRDLVERAMPQLGQTVASPNRNGKSTRIRVYLNPNGQVQAVQEADKPQPQQKKATP